MLDPDRTRLVSKFPPQFTVKKSLAHIIWRTTRAHSQQVPSLLFLSSYSIANEAITSLLSCTVKL